MSNKEKVIRLLDEIPEYKLPYVLAYMQGVAANADAEDELYCSRLYDDYINSPEKEEYETLEDVAKRCGVSMDEIQNFN